MTFAALKKRVWFYSPKLEPWRKKLVLILRARVPSEKNILWILSSGTQSVNQIKAIGISTESILCAAEAANRHLQSSSGDRWLRAIPEYHIGGLSIYARASLSGAKVDEFNSKWNPRAFFSALGKNKSTLTSLVPTQIFDLVKGGFCSPPALRAVVIGGGALNPRLYSRARELGWPLLPSYGLTECSSQVATADLKSLQQSEFPPLAVLPHVKVKLREQRLLLQSAALCRWIATANSDGVFTLEDVQPNGWFTTEDAAEKIAGGLKILGRRDEIVKILGTLVPIQEVEQQAREFFMGLGGEMCIIATNSARAENRLMLVSDTKSSLREWEKLLLRFNARVEGPRRISGLVWVANIPHGALGKILKPALLQSLFPQA